MMDSSKGYKSPLLQASGFSLISVLVALGLVGIVTMTTLHLVKMINTQARYVANFEDMMNVTKEVTSILAVPQSCLNVFGSTAVDKTNIGPSATTQLEVSTAIPDPTNNPTLKMGDISSGKIKVISMGLVLKRILPGAGTAWYQGEAVVQADDPADPGNFRSRRIPVNFQLNAANTVVSCAAAGVTIGGAGGISSSSGLPYGQCGPGQVVIGISTNGVICTGGAQTTSGKGCTGDLCIATDGGPCYGPFCKTNGALCQGDGCIACGTDPGAAATPATCTGALCCAGPTCTGC
jgi:Tfp pilus assembly major pilin PilA